MVCRGTGAGRIATFTLMIGMAGAAARAHADSFYISAEAPGVQDTTAAFTSVGVETFNGYGAFAGQVINTTSNFGGTIAGLTATITGVLISPADQYGGAGGIGYYPNDHNASFSIVLSQDVNYFGLWISAMNNGNVVTLFNSAGTQLTTFDTSSMNTLIGGNSAYYGNPTGPFLGKDSGEPYAFVNFFDQTGSFNTIVISGGGFESDNYTVGTFTTETGTGVSGTPTVSDVPEPASLALLGVGLAGLGALRRRRPRDGG